MEFNKTLRGLGPAYMRDPRQTDRPPWHRVILTGHIEVDEPFISTHFVGGNALVHDGNIGFLDHQFADRLIKEVNVIVNDGEGRDRIFTALRRQWDRQQNTNSKILPPSPQKPLK